MKQTDKAEFTVVLARTWRFYDKAITPEALSDWWDLLEAHDFAAVAAAFRAHLTDPQHGRYPPKPADILQHLHAARADGHPEPEEAWGLLARFIGDERETGCYTEPMRVAWRACQPVFDLGDEIGARMGFLETYRRALRAARERREPPRWRMSLGTDPERRSSRLWEAVDQHRISADYATSLLPATPGQLEHVAGLLETPVAAPDPAPLAQRLRDLAAQLRASGARDRTGTGPAPSPNDTGTVPEGSSEQPTARTPRNLEHRP